MTASDDTLDPQDTENQKGAAEENEP